LNVMSIKKYIQKKIYKVINQYSFAEQTNKLSEENSILLVCAASTVSTSPIHYGF
jgi:hypothetical protein